MPNLRRLTALLTIVAAALAALLAPYAMPAGAAPLFLDTPTPNGGNGYYVTDWIEFSYVYNGGGATWGSPPRMQGTYWSDGSYTVPTGNHLVGYVAEVLSESITVGDVDIRSFFPTGYTYVNNGNIHSSPRCFYVGGVSESNVPGWLTYDTEVCDWFAPSVTEVEWAGSAGYKGPGASITLGGWRQNHYQSEQGTLATWRVRFILYGPLATETPTPTGTNTPTNTPTVTETPTVTQTFTPAVVLSTGSYLRDGNFETNPDLNIIGLSPWINSFWDVGRYIFAPSDLYTPYQQVVDPLCGSSFYQLDVSPHTVPDVGVFDHTGTYVEQEFDWPENKHMYVSLAARTSDTDTFGVVRLLGPGGTINIFEPSLSNTTGDWQFFYWVKSNAPAGRYVLQVEGGTVGGNEGHIALDMASVTEGYWVNECGAQTAPYWTQGNQAVVTATAAAPTITGTVNPAYLTQIAGTSTAVYQTNSTSTQVAGLTATKAAGSTATQGSIRLTQGWQTATAIGNGVATLVAAGQNTQAVLTQTAFATNRTATAAYGATSTAFVSNFRGTLTSQAAATQTRQAIVATQVYGQVSTANAYQTQVGAVLTSTYVAQETQEAVPPIILQLTLQAQVAATNAFILTQQAIGQSTAIANATATANATTEAQLTQLAQIQITLQALTTLQATQQVVVQGTAVGQTQVDTTLPPLTAWAWDEGCVRPQTALNIPMWIDYSTCRMMSWLSWQEENTLQITYLFDLSKQREPFATINAFATMTGQVMGILGSVDWDGSASCEGDMFQLIQPAGDILQGNLQLEEADEISFECTLPFEDVLGPQLNQGMCWAYNVLCSKGIMQLIRYAVNVALVAAFIAYIQVIWIGRAQA